MGFTNNKNLKDIAYKRESFSATSEFRSKLVYKGLFDKIEDFPIACEENIGVICSIKNGETYICTGFEWEQLRILGMTNDPNGPLGLDGSSFLDMTEFNPYNISFTYDCFNILEDV